MIATGKKDTVGRVATTRKQPQQVRTMTTVMILTPIPHFAQRPDAHPARRSSPHQNPSH